MAVVASLRRRDAPADQSITDGMFVAWRNGGFRIAGEYQYDDLDVAMAAFPSLPWRDLPAVDEENF